MQVNSNTSLFNKHGKSGVGNLERTRIPTLSGNKTEFQHWKATFTSCVDVFCSVQNVDICQDWRQYCLSDEALETIKGLRYSEALLFIVLFAKNFTNQIKSNHLNSHGEEAQEKSPGF